jgi:putative transposase
MRVHVLPYGDVLAWCLMPNHFHLMVRVNEIELEVSKSGGATSSRTPTENLNKSIGIMLSSYTRAINKQEKTSGSLFRDKTKAECLNCPEGITPSFFNSSQGTQLNNSLQEKEYPQVCFIPMAIGNIHQNPV